MSGVHRSFHFLLLFSMAICTSLQADEQPTNSKQALTQPFMKVDDYIQRNLSKRSMMDLVQMPLAKMQEGWSVIEIEPGKQSGWGQFGPGVPGRIEKELRNLTKVNLWIRYEGSWKCLSQKHANPDMPRSGNFLWFDPSDINRTFQFQPTPEANRFKKYVFLYGGTILCRHELNTLDGTPFKDAFLLPKGEVWTKAAQEIATQPELAQRVEGAIDADRLQSLRVVQNPLLAIYTVRRMLETEGIQAARQEQIVRDIWAGNEPAQPYLAFLLSRPPADAAKTADEILMQLIMRTKTKKELASLAQGLFVSVSIAGSERDHTTKARLMPYFPTVHEQAIQLNAGDLVQRLELFLGLKKD